MGAGGAGEDVYFRDAVRQQASEQAREGRETGYMASLSVAGCRVAGPEHGCPAVFCLLIVFAVSRVVRAPEYIV